MEFSEMKRQQIDLCLEVVTVKLCPFYTPLRTSRNLACVVLATSTIAYHSIHQQLHFTVNTQRRFVHCHRISSS